MIGDEDEFEFADIADAVETIRLSIFKVAGFHYAISYGNGIVRRLSSYGATGAAVADARADGGEVKVLAVIEEHNKDTRSAIIGRIGGGIHGDNRELADAVNDELEYFQQRLAQELEEFAALFRQG